MSPATTDVTRGEVLDDRYRIDDVLGHGGTATVYRAWDSMLEREVALKLFPPTPDEDQALRYEAEIGLLAQLSHPGLVALYGAGVASAGNHRPQTFIVMELVRGPTLADVLRAGPLPSDHVAEIGAQLAGALAAVHAAKVVHRDVKPANVLLVEGVADATTPPVVKLADFGIARMSDAARLTVTGTTNGTVTYLSPEQAAGEAVGPPTDVYALGLILLECLTGGKVFVGTVAEVTAARLTTDPPIPSGLGARWVALLRDMTRREPGARVPMTEASARLSSVHDALTGTVVIPRTAEPGLVGAGSGTAVLEVVGTEVPEPVENAHAAVQGVARTRVLLDEAADAGQLSVASHRTIDDALRRTEAELATVVEALDPAAPEAHSDSGGSDG